MIALRYKQMCPNCGGDIESDRLAAGLLCRRCMPESAEPCEVADKAFRKVCRVWDEAEEFGRFFAAKMGFGLRSLQQMWARRFFLGRSFALLAPTGVGKTTFGLALASYLPEKSYLIFPTQLLAKQAFKKLQALGEEPLLYDSRASGKQKEAVKQRIAAGDFRILITTTSFLYRNFALIPKAFAFVFVDDVDSILKSARNIDKVLMLLGFSEADIQRALQIIDAKRKGDLDPEELAKLQEEVQLLRQKARGRLIVSSATANPKSRRIHLFRELLGFEVSRPSITIRNVADLYEEPGNLWQRAAERIKEFGSGGLVFLPGNETKERLEEFVAFLQDEGIEAASYEDFDEEAFRSGKTQVLVGFASYRNPLARGIDMPDVIRYALFVGVPKLTFTLDLSNHVTLYYFLLSLLPAVREEEFFADLQRYVGYLQKLIHIPAERLTQSAKEHIAQIYEKLTEALTPHIIEKINQNPNIALVKDERFHLITADVTGYIQASGRTSRLYAGGLSQGLALTLVDSAKAFCSLQKKVRWFSDAITFQRADEVDIEAIFAKIDADRERIRLSLAGKLQEARDLFTTTLVIVESPNKARTIAGFYGKPMVRDFGAVRVYEVAKENRILLIAASKGHLFDLNKEEGYFGVEMDGGMLPIFEPIDAQRLRIVQTLREEGIEVQEVFIATDPDVEGEKISYDVALNLKPYNPHIKRAEFHEVTKRAFDAAIEEPRSFDEDLVRAQLVRRIADRWIGFAVSQFLQRRLGRKTLSAGRVQSAVLEWIVLCEYEAKQRIWVVQALLDGITAEFVFENKEAAKSFFDALQEVTVRYEKIEEVPLFREPFTTDAMLFEAANRLHFSPQTTMQLAQDLFEAGLITYHRTDSTRVSAAGIAIAKEYITERFGADYFTPRTHAKAGGAHECIRPTRAMDAEQLRSFLALSGRTTLDSRHIRLYDLIFRNFIASQMRETIAKEITARIEALDQAAQVRFYSQILRHGIDLVWPVALHSVGEGNVAVQKDLRERPKVPHYTYAQIIQMMKERGIGRPSTYANTIQKLEERRYIIQRKGVLIATKLGIRVYEELRKHKAIYAFVNEHYTKELEAVMDRVERGEADYQEVLYNLYRTLQERL